MGHQVYVLEQDKGRREFHGVVTDFFKEEGDGITTLWYNAHREWRKALTWPLDVVWKDRFKGRNLCHAMAVIRHAAKVFNDVDVVVCSDGYSYAVPAALLKRLGLLDKPLVVSFIGGDILDLPEARYGQPRTVFNNRMFGHVYKYADLLRPVSPLLEDVIRRDLGASDKIRVCPSHLAICRSFGSDEDLAAFRRTSRQELIRRLEIGGMARIVVAVSGGDYGKGMHLLPDALKMVQDGLSELVLVFVGPMTEHMESVRKRCDTLNLADKVRFLGRVPHDQMLSYLGGSDLNVAPTLGEGLNMVVVEAACVGTPSIITEAAGISHWVSSFASGLVVAAGDSSVLGDAMSRFFALSAEERMMYGRNALGMSEEFRVEKVAARLVDIFREAVHSDTDE